MAEEIGVDMTGVELAYMESGFFVTDDGDPVINVAFRGQMPAHAKPVAASPQGCSRVGLTWDGAGAWKIASRDHRDRFPPPAAVGLEGGPEVASLQVGALIQQDGLVVPESG